MVKRYLNYDDMMIICNEINNKHIPTEEAFFDKLDQLFETEDLWGFSFLLHSFRELLAVVDSEITTIEKKVQLAPTCMKGCANCCYFPIIITRAEAKLMIGAINNYPEPRKTDLLNHFNSYYQNYHTEMEDISSIQVENEDLLKQQYITKQLPCIFLNVHTNDCMAYDIRPIPCRTYINYSDPVVCREHFIPKEPFSYEFLRSFYIEALNEVVQTVLLEENENFGINYPDDFFAIDYLPILLKAESAKQRAK